MKFRNRLLIPVLVATLLCCSLLLGACGGTTDTANGGKKDYKVAVKDALGNPYTAGVVVQFHQNGSMVAMQIVNPETGIATKNLEAGDYTVKQTTDCVVPLLITLLAARCPQGQAQNGLYGFVSLGLPRSGSKRMVVRTSHLFRKDLRKHPDRVWN